MATLNLSTNGPSIKKSYEVVVNGPAPTGGPAGSPTFGQWAVFSVAAPLVNAFQQDAGKESVLKVQSTGEGELLDLVDEFSDGRVQFAFVKVKDPNTTLPKSVLIAWCGEGVPERTKGYFTSHLNAVSKLLHGYHIQITARSDRDLTPESIVQKVADSSGSKYSGATAAPQSRGAPPVASKPAFTPTRIGGAGSGFNPLGSRSRVADSTSNTDGDGWGADAPQVTRTQLEKVAPAYKPTKVNMADLQSQQEPSRFSAPAQDNAASDVVRGGYQPIGKVDIAAIRRQAKESGSGAADDRPTIVKGAYEPVGKVDIAAIRAKAQGPGNASPAAAQPARAPAQDDEEPPKSLAERSAAFSQSERLTSLPKPKVANKFGSGTASFAGTKAPTPASFGPKPTTAAPVGIASRTFADEGGKTPAQLWAEKKARQGGGAPVASPATSGGFGAGGIASQQSGDGGWKSSYSGKSWAPVQTTHTGKSAGSDLAAQRTGQDDQQEDEGAAAAGGVGAIRDRFKDTAPIGVGAPPRNVPEPSESSPPPTDFASKPNAGASRPMPGLPTRPAAPVDDDEEEQVSTTQRVPPPPAQPPRSPSPPTPDEIRSASPIRVAMPVGRGTADRKDEDEQPPLPTQSLAQAASAARAVPNEPQVEDDDVARGTAAATTSTFSPGGSAPAAATGGQRALVQYDYEKAEDNEVELHEGEYVTNIDMVDDDWWMGTNSRGESGLFPANYVELVEDETPAAPVAAAVPQASAAQSVPPPRAAAPAAAGSRGPTATAQYDYEAAEDNELGFPDGAKITGIEFPDDDWWFGHYGGKEGLFPANYVTLDD